MSIMPEVPSFHVWFWSFCGAGSDHFPNSCHIQVKFYDYLISGSRILRILSNFALILIISSIAGLGSGMRTGAGLSKLLRSNPALPPPSARKQSLQRTGFLPFGLKGTSHSLPHLPHVVLVMTGLSNPRSPPPKRGLLKLGLSPNFFPFPKFLIPVLYYLIGYYPNLGHS